MLLFFRFPALDFSAGSEAVDSCLFNLRDRFSKACALSFLLFLSIIKRGRFSSHCAVISSDAMPAAAFFYRQCLVEIFCERTSPSRNQALQSMIPAEQTQPVAVARFLPPESFQSAAGFLHLPRQ
jgi:hypothetical protein